MPPTPLHLPSLFNPRLPETGVQFAAGEGGEGALVIEQEGQAALRLALLLVLVMLSVPAQGQEQPLQWLLLHQGPRAHPRAILHPPHLHR